MQLTLYSGRLDRLTIYSFMLAVTTMFHQLCFGLHFIFSVNTILTLAALALLLKPGSVILLITLTLFSAVNGYIQIPDIHNHIFFQTIIDLLVLVSVSYVLLLHYKKPNSADSQSKVYIREEMFDAFAPVARMSLIILYFFAVFHKLNDTFFDTRYSPSVKLLKDTLRFIPHLHLGNTVRTATIWLTILFECGIPVMLCFKRTRTAGILAALFFHFFLAINLFWVPLTSFSAMVYSTLFTFTDREFPNKVWQLFNKINKQLAEKKGKALIWPAGVIILLLLAACLLAIYKGYPQNVVTILFVFWWLIITTIFLCVMRSSPITQEQPLNILSFHWPVQWIVPLILLFNGMNPYLGLKTDYSFNLFTGLNTEGGKSNHFFMPQWFKIAGYQDDLVQILSSNNPQLIKYGPESNLLLTYFDFQRIVGKSKIDFFVDYKRNGKLLRLEKNNAVYNDAEVLKPHSWLANKFLAFKPIASGTPKIIK